MRAEAIVCSGLAAKGYRYINIDEGWWSRRGAQGRLVIRTGKSPSACAGEARTSFRPVADKLSGTESARRQHRDAKANGTPAQKKRLTPNFLRHS